MHMGYFLKGDKQEKERGRGGQGVCRVKGRVKSLGEGGSKFLAVREHKLTDKTYHYLHRLRNNGRTNIKEMFGEGIGSDWWTFLRFSVSSNDMLIGPDWAMNVEICDILNRDPTQAKDVVKGIKKKIGSKNTKVQLLALTLLETIIKNCGDIVHMHVVERDVLHEMVRIAKKRPDIHVRT
ncbi:hypothetical protein K1719_033561 [Acacia pycnantha]|nr:hypothetical protein K1719_033561 [Acacia pycnantha]